MRRSCEARMRDDRFWSSNFRSWISMGASRTSERSVVTWRVSWALKASTPVMLARMERGSAMLGPLHVMDMKKVF